MSPKKKVSEPNGHKVTTADNADWGAANTASWDTVATPAAEPIAEGQADTWPESLEVPEAAPVAEDAWDSSLEPSLSPIIIQQHSGRFNPDVLKLLVYGESGTGKTRFASTFPDVIFADIDQGMSSVTETVDRVGIYNFRELQALHAFLASGNHSYATLVLDTLNEMQRIAMGATIEEFPMIRRSYENLPSQSDYGKMLHDMIELTHKFIQLPMRVVLLAQVNSRQFDTDVLQPQLIGKNTAREIARKMDVIGYIFKSEKEDPNTQKKLPEISFDATDYVTKDRSYRLPSSLVDPTYMRVAAFWK